jgi:hypothetical protein
LFARSEFQQNQFSLIVFKAEAENQTGTLTVRESAQTDLQLKAGWPREFLPTPHYKNAPDKLPVSWLETEHNIAKGE